MSGGRQWEEMHWPAVFELIQEAAALLDISGAHAAKEHDKQLGRLVVEEALGQGAELWSERTDSLHRSVFADVAAANEAMPGERYWQGSVLALTERLQEHLTVNVPRSVFYCAALADSLNLFQSSVQGASYRDDGWLAVDCRQIAEEYSRLFGLALDCAVLESVRQDVMFNGPFVGLAARSKAEYRLVCIRLIIAGKYGKNNAQDRYFDEYCRLLTEFMRYSNNDDLLGYLLNLAEKAMVSERNRSVSVSFIEKQLSVSRPIAEALVIIYESLPRGAFDGCFAYIGKF